ncbi:hypothetical protein Ciccas_008116 [Cichlidogyrus casuarinus]|uniref:Uncharacterized protein n=1 Tax=Cichlidogyrus casuarinus TaxID=1844966 RepID=A0ABD2Q0V5_9PLAT
MKLRISRDSLNPGAFEPCGRLAVLSTELPFNFCWPATNDQCRKRTGERQGSRCTYACVHASASHANAVLGEGKLTISQRRRVVCVLVVNGMVHIPGHRFQSVAQGCV